MPKTVRETAEELDHNVKPEVGAQTVAKESPSEVLENIHAGKIDIDKNKDSMFDHQRLGSLPDDTPQVVDRQADSQMGGSTQVARPKTFQNTRKFAHKTPGMFSPEASYGGKSEHFGSYEYG